MHKNYLPLTFIFALCATLSSAQYLSVESGELPPYNVPVNLLRDHFTGQGIEILDVQFDGVPGAVGYFTGGDSTIGLHRGLIMSTGRTATKLPALGAERLGKDFANTNNGVEINDALLATQSTGTLYDLVRYRIIFRTSSDSVRFRYVFASEEYPEYSCTPYNDIFGFYLQGLGYPTPVNIARVPGSNLPVSINNVHPYNSMNNPNPNPCPPFNEQYFHDNYLKQKQPIYDGYLNVFTAEAAVVPCDIYVMTLALADVNDALYDSAVFLEANSLESTVDISASFTPGQAIIPENANADTILLTFHNIPSTLLPLTVNLGGVAQFGTDYLTQDSVFTVYSADTVLQFAVQPIPDTINELAESVTLTVRDIGCFYRVFTLFIADTDTTFNPVDSLVVMGPEFLTAPLPTELNNLNWSAANNTPLDIPDIQTLAFSDLDIQLGTAGNSSLSTLFDISMLQSVCVNVDHDNVGHLSMYLFAPDGQFMELSSGNGGSGDNYTNTCFSPSATQSITFGLPNAPPSAAPFTGMFQPEGSWNDIKDSPLSGIWRLGLIDNSSNDLGQLLNWSMSFSGTSLGDFKYLWSTGDTSPSIMVSDTGTYAVTVSNAVSAFTKTFVLYTPCHSSDSITVVIQPGEQYQFGGQQLSQPGDYSLTIPTTNGCDSTIYLHLELASAINAPVENNRLSFSPNPSNGETQVLWPADATYSRIRVLDMSGRSVFSENIDGKKTIVLHTNRWIPGRYTVMLEEKGQKSARGSLLVK